MATKKRYPSQSQEQFVVRLPDGMRAQIAAEAQAAGRSMNAEVVQRLQDSLSSSIPLDRTKIYANAYIAGIVDLLKLEHLPARFKEAALVLAKRAESFAALQSSELAILTNGSPGNGPADKSLGRLLVDNRLCESDAIQAEIDKTEAILRGMSSVPTTDPEFQSHRQYLIRLEYYRNLIANGIEYIENPRLPGSSDEPAEIRPFPKGTKAPG